MSEKKCVVLLLQFTSGYLLAFGTTYSGYRLGGAPWTIV
jgi:hypothetical protein